MCHSAREMHLFDKFKIDIIGTYIFLYVGM